MKKILFTFVLSFYVLISLNAQEVNRVGIGDIDGDPIPSIITSPWSFDLGKIEPGETISKTIMVKNGAGDNVPWEINKSSNNTFTIKHNGNEINKIWLDEDEEVELKVIFEAPHEGGEFEEWFQFVHAHNNFYDSQKVVFAGEVSDDCNSGPTVPGNLRVSSKSQTKFTIKWNESSDNIDVKGYEVYKDGEKYSTTSRSAEWIKGLNSNTTYNIKVRAFDGCPKYSNFASKNVKTRPEPFNVYISGPTKADNTGTYTWSANVSPGDIAEPPYSYSWKYKYNYGESYRPWGSGSSRTESMPYNRNLMLKLIVTDANNTVRTAEFMTLNISSIHPYSKTKNNKNSESNSNKDKKKKDSEILKNSNIRFHNISVYPNPGKGRFKVNLPSYSDESFITVSSITGKRLLKKQITSNQEIIDISGQPDGIYIFTIKINGNMVEKKIIKE